nr:unnamed protein product [Spirometra erinaceieuropaei]
MRDSQISTAPNTQRRRSSVPNLPTMSTDVPSTNPTYWTSFYQHPESSLPSSSYFPPSDITPAPAEATPVSTTTEHNPDVPTNGNLPAINASDNLIHTCPHCDRTSASHICLANQDLEHPHTLSASALRVHTALAHSLTALVY